MRLPPWDDGTLAKLFHRLRQLRDILLAAEQTGRIDRPGPFGPDDECCCTDARGEVENTFAVGARHASPRADDKDPFAWQAPPPPSGVDRDQLRCAVFAWRDGYNKSGKHDGCILRLRKESLQIISVRRQLAGCNVRRTEQGGYYWYGDSHLICVRLSAPRLLAPVFSCVVAGRGGRSVGPDGQARIVYRCQLGHFVPIKGNCFGVVCLQMARR